MIRILLAYLLFSFLVALYAHGKGRSGVRFFLASLLFTPLIALIALLVMGDNVAELVQRDIRSGRKKTCPHCAEPIQSAAVVCKHCGREL